MSERWRVSRIVFDPRAGEFLIDGQGFPWYMDGPVAITISCPEFARVRIAIRSEAVEVERTQGEVPSVGFTADTNSDTVPSLGDRLRDLHNNGLHAGPGLGPLSALADEADGLAAERDQALRDGHPVGTYRCRLDDGHDGICVSREYIAMRAERDQALADLGVVTSERDQWKRDHEHCVTREVALDAVRVAGREAREARAERDEARAERDAAVAGLDRVTAVVDDAVKGCDTPGTPCRWHDIVSVARIRAAVDGGEGDD